MFWFLLYHDYFIPRAKHFSLPCLNHLPNDFIYLHKPSAILIWQPLFNMGCYLKLVIIPQDLIYIGQIS